jgi:hypothetical protein
VALSRSFRVQLTRSICPLLANTNAGRPLDKGDFARGKIVDSADHTNLFLGYHFGQDWLRALQALSVVAHVGDNGALL